MKEKNLQCKQGINRFDIFNDILNTEISLNIPREIKEFRIRNAIFSEKNVRANVNAIEKKLNRLKSKMEEIQKKSNYKKKSEIERDLAALRGLRELYKRIARLYFQILGNPKENNEKPIPFSLEEKPVPPINEKEEDYIKTIFLFNEEKPMDLINEKIEDFEEMYIDALEKSRINKLRRLGLDSKNKNIEPMDRLFQQSKFKDIQIGVRNRIFDEFITESIEDYIDCTENMMAENSIAGSLVLKEYNIKAIIDALEQRIIERDDIFYYLNSWSVGDDLLGGNQKRYEFGEIMKKISADILLKTPQEEIIGKIAKGDYETQIEINLMIGTENCLQKEFLEGMEKRAEKLKNIGERLFLLQTYEMNFVEGYYEYIKFIEDMINGKKNIEKNYTVLYLFVEMIKPLEGEFVKIERKYKDYIEKNIDELIANSTKNVSKEEK